uniref:Uncharacterized protein n=1 Tax=Oryctolagus cuniculus TaxID=9986 RepID=A0A5F9D5R9_RABIT
MLARRSVPDGPQPERELCTPEKSKPATQGREPASSQVLIRSRVLRENGKYIPKQSFLTWKYYFNNPEDGFFKKTKRKVVPPSPVTDPTTLTDVVKGNVTNFLPMILIGGWINIWHTNVAAKETACRTRRGPPWILARRPLGVLCAVGFCEGEHRTPSYTPFLVLVLGLSDPRLGTHRPEAYVASRLLLLLVVRPANSHKGLIIPEFGTRSSSLTRER